MATSDKHRKRSRRSGRKTVDFTDFNRKASVKKAFKEQKDETTIERLKKVFHRTTNK